MLPIIHPAQGEKILMKKLLIALTLGLAACGNAQPSGPDTSNPGPDTSNPGPDTSNPSAEPSSPPEGYTRFAPMPIEVAPGKDETWCQWVTAPAEADIDIMDITGEQVFPGHHSIIFATTAAEPVGTSRLCSAEDSASVQLLGGVGGEGGASAFPKGAVVRLKKGMSLMMNNHYLNTSDQTVIGKSTLDVKFAPPSPDHVVASFFANITVKFALMPLSETTVDATCVLPHDIKLLDYSNHMHDFGTKVSTEVIHADATVEDLQRDETWSYEWQFNPPRQQWTVEAPHVLKAGDTLHTQCTWKNTSPDMLTFPREMCLGAGFILADKDAFCIDGEWKE
jgi:hypothetical protein